MSQNPRHIKTDRSLNRPTEQRAKKASASRPVQPAQPDFFAEEGPAEPLAQAAAQSRPVPRLPQAEASRPAAAKRRKRPRSGSRWS